MTELMAAITIAIMRAEKGNLTKVMNHALCLVFLSRCPTIECCNPSRPNALPAPLIVRIRLYRLQTTALIASVYMSMSIDINPRPRFYIGCVTGPLVYLFSTFVLPCTSVGCEFRHEQHDYAPRQFQCRD